MTKDVIIYLWDGEPPPHTTVATPSLPPFYNRYDLEHPPLVEGSRQEPLLAAVTGHSLSCVPDWTVPIFVFDEYADSEIMTNLRPGDIVRIINLHCVVKTGVGYCSISQNITV